MGSIPTAPTTSKEAAISDFCLYFALAFLVPFVAVLSQLRNGAATLEQLSREDFPALVERFWGVTDSLLRRVEIHYAASGRRAVEVEISTQDSARPSGETWVNLLLCFEDVGEFQLKEEPNTADPVINDGLQSGVQEGLLFVDFFGIWNEPLDRSHCRQSPLYLAARSVSWGIRSYGGGPWALSLPGD